MAKKRRHGQDETTSKQQAAETVRFPIVGIGASAGGLEAMEALFAAMPSNTGAGLWIVRMKALPSPPPLRSGLHSTSDRTLSPSHRREDAHLHH